MSTNPFEPPKEVNEPHHFADSSPGELERRVAELERQVRKSWFLRPNFLTRVIAVWAYLAIGYLMLLTIMAPIVLLVEWLVGLFE